MHKRSELDTNNPPGQIVNPIPKQECEKLTFEQWMETKLGGCYGYDKTRPDDFLLWGMPGYLIRKIWQDAQENK